ncbi:transcription termination/antitermination protein NusA [Listeria monocytogenes]|uniref:transcription termination/antitermination protein NusA n=1 Tax=Listeria monocytogenes TaxID=1639 RepID=UPI000D72A277|nr:transcription termination/antitermination protein NusA [Listeria monocytogenes]PXF00741.1 transcription termination/antitermination protein NusA [Listeria monocytogenes]
MSTELLDALHVLEHDKGISREVLVEAIEAALTSAYKRNFKDAQNVRVDLNMENGSIRVLARKEAVEQVFDSRLEISMEEAHKLNPVYKPGDVVELEVTPKDFGRIAAQTAKQVVTQRVREAERGIIYDEFIDREDDIMTGIVERQDSRFIYVNLGKIEAILSQNEQMPNETYHAHDRIKVYLTKVEKTTKGPQIFVSRTHPGLLKRLFEMEVPEIYDGVVEIKSVAREAGAEDPFTFVANALSPSKVLDVIVNEADQATTVIVPDYQLSLAIGKRGQNARLAAKLTGWKIDIKSETVATELGIYPRNDVEAPEVEDAESETYTEDEE